MPTIVAPGQLGLFDGLSIAPDCSKRSRRDIGIELMRSRKGQPYRSEELPDFSQYQSIVIAFSGKDSLACLLYLLSLGVPANRIELWHHCVDGHNPGLMDWRCTVSYVRALAQHFGVRLYLSWKEGGFESEMLRSDEASQVSWFETPDGLCSTGGNGHQKVTRLRFPQMGKIRSGRWCSPVLKIDLGRSALRSQVRFENAKTLFISGERRLESVDRSKYLAIEVHSADARNSPYLRRHIDHWRPVIDWDEAEVWRIIEQFSINPHPCYRIGWGRCSCQFCIFGSYDQWATLRLIDPVRFEQIAEYEKQFNYTIHRTLSIHQRADLGKPYGPLEPDDILAAQSVEFTQPIFLSSWRLPLGAFGDGSGPD